MRLSAIPQILTLLNENGIISYEQKQKVIEDLNESDRLGKRKFAGEIAVDRGYLTKSTLDHFLSEQAVLKAEAAVADLQEILKTGPQECPKWLKANWGNNGVNPATSPHSRADGISASANIAQNLVLTLNSIEGISELEGSAKNTFVKAVCAAANLARGISRGSSSVVPLAEKHVQWSVECEDGLYLAAEISSNKFCDTKGVEIEVSEYLFERLKEVKCAVKKIVETPKEIPYRDL